MAKPITKTPRGQEQRHVDIRSGACESKQNGRPVRQYGCTQILYLREEAVLLKTPRYKSSDCSAEAILRSSWPIHYCLKNRTGHTAYSTTVTLRRMRAEG